MPDVLPYSQPGEGKSMTRRSHRRIQCARATCSRSMMRDAYRRSLVTGIESSVSGNMVESLSYSYDAKSRRVRKITPEAAATYFYDDWNLIEERVAYTNGITLTIHYYWGKDLSGTLQGAGGVGGLLYLTVDSTIYVP